MKTFAYGAIALFAIAGSAAAQDTLAYWAQNNNGLSGGSGFGFEVGDFPQAADFGVVAGSSFLQPNSVMLSSVTGTKYDDVESFGGTSLGAQFGEGSGGSFAPEGQQLNGQWFDVVVDASNYLDLEIAWAQRGTSTGFNSRIVSVSTDGVNFTNIYSNFGVLSSSWTLETADASTLLDGAATATFRFTLDGATSINGNNRFDNILVTGTLIPAPGAVALAGLAGLAGLRRRRA